MTKYYKILFISMILISSLISISSYSWLGMWMGLEINLLSIIPLMNDKKNLLSSESSIKYFVVQATASTVILLAVIVMMMQSSMTTNSMIKAAPTLMMNSSLLTKMGMAPFHFWFPEVMEGLDWLNCILILTWQKLAPMILLMYNMEYSSFTSMIIISAMIISGIMSANQISLRKILAYSSINHMGWMISTMMVMETIWMYYFTIYTIITVNIVLMFKTWKVFLLSQLFQTMNFSMMKKMLFMLNFLSLSGIPPFLGFMPKWLTIQALMEKKIIFLPTLMIMMTLGMIYVYVRMMMTSLLMSSNEPSWNKTFKMKLSSFKLSMMNFFSITSLITITIMFNMT